MRSRFQGDTDKCPHEACQSAICTRLVLHSTAGPELGKNLHLWSSVNGGLCSPSHPHYYLTHSMDSLDTSGMGRVGDLMVKNLSNSSSWHPVCSVNLVRETRLFCSAFCYCFCTRSQFGSPLSSLSLPIATQRHTSHANLHQGKD